MVRSCVSASWGVTRSPATAEQQVRDEAGADIELDDAQDTGRFSGRLRFLRHRQM